MESLLSYSPSSIIFSIAPGTQTTTHLTLTNITSAPLAYKVKTTHIKRYCVRPNAAILAPSEQLTIEVIQQAHSTPPPDLDDCRDRFLLQAVKLSDIPNLPPNCPVTTVWDMAPADVIVKTKFAVCLQLAAENTPQLVHTLPPRLPSDPVHTVPPSDVVTRAEPKPRADADTTHLSVLQDFVTTAPLQQASTPEPSVASKSSVIPPPPSRMPPELPTAPPSTPSISISPPASTISFALSTLQVPLPPERRPSPILPASPALKPSATSATPITPRTPTSTTAGAARDHEEVDYKSVEYTRSRALDVRPAPRVSPPTLDQDTRQRVAAERTSELCRAIGERQEQIDKTKRKLAEARLKLSDAQTATSPAYDVCFQLDENARIPLLQTCIMTLISGALLSLLLGK